MGLSIPIDILLQLSYNLTTTVHILVTMGACEYHLISIFYIKKFESLSNIPVMLRNSINSKDLGKTTIRLHCILHHTMTSSKKKRCDCAYPSSSQAKAKTSRTPAEMMYSCALKATPHTTKRFIYTLGTCLSSHLDYTILILIDKSFPAQSVFRGNVGNQSEVAF